jgi:hypothetical protein
MRALALVASNLILSFEPSGSHGPDVLYQGTTLQLAEKLMFLKGTAYLAAASIRPYVNAL